MTWSSVAAFTLYAILRAILRKPLWMSKVKSEKLFPTEQVYDPSYFIYSISREPERGQHL